MYGDWGLHVMGKYVQLLFRFTFNMLSHAIHLLLLLNMDYIQLGNRRFDDLVVTVQLNNLYVDLFIYI